MKRRADAAPAAPAPTRSRIIAFAGQKGGVGKSTCATAVAAELEARGRRVLLVDTDRQRSALGWADARELQLQGADALAAAQAPRAGSLAVIAMGDGMHRTLPGLAAGYDVTVIDCPPQLADAQRAALGVADLVVLPCGPGGPDVIAMAGSVALVREAMLLRPRLRAVVLITRRVAGTVLGRHVRATLERTELPVLVAECSHRVTYQEAFSAGLGPTTYDPPSAAAGEVRHLVDELAGLLVAVA